MPVRSTQSACAAPLSRGNERESDCENLDPRVDHIGGLESSTDRAKIRSRRYGWRSLTMILPVAAVHGSQQGERPRCPRRSKLAKPAAAMPCPTVLQPPETGAGRCATGWRPCRWSGFGGCAACSPAVRPPCGALPDVVVPNFHRRYTGVSATVQALIPYQRERISVGLWDWGGLPLAAQFCWFDLWRHGWTKPAHGGKRIWHARRDLEIVVGLLLREVLRQPWRVVFTSAAPKPPGLWLRWLSRNWYRQAPMCWWIGSRLETGSP